MNTIRTGFVNTKGLNTIKEWIESTSAIDDAGPLHSTSARALDAWASDVERHLNDMQNGPWCEMLCTSTRSGRTETLVLSDDCIDWSEQVTD